MASATTQDHDRDDVLSPTMRSSFNSEVEETEQAGLLNSDYANDDVDHMEKGGVPAVQEASNHEDTVPTRIKLFALAGYFLCNVGLTMYNKAILGSVSFRRWVTLISGVNRTDCIPQFRFPWLLTALHCGCSFIGCTFMLHLGHFQAAKLTRRENLALLAFSLLFTINIAISNVSLYVVPPALPRRRCDRVTNLILKGDGLSTLPPGRSCHDSHLHNDPLPRPVQ
jgi:hypothetical protein